MFMERRCRQGKVTGNWNDIHVPLCNDAKFNVAALAETNVKMGSWPSQRCSPVAHSMDGKLYMQQTDTFFLENVELQQRCYQQFKLPSDDPFHF